MDMIVIFVLLCLFTIVWIYLLKKDKLVNIDNKFYDSLNIKEPKITFFKIFTNLASTIFLIVMCSLLVIFLKDKKLALIYASLMIIDAGIVFVIKHIFKRDRPNKRRLVKEKGYSFPSGHTVSSCAFYGFLIFLINISGMNIIFKLLMDLVIILLIILIGYSRIFLGVHYFSDVVGGLLIGSSYVILFIYFINDIWRLI